MPEVGALVMEEWELERERREPFRFVLPLRREEREEMLGAEEAEE